jgi:dephospho-CoA kinase
MKLFGITGGVGSGKSLFRKTLEKMGYLTFDADTIARHILPNHTPEVEKIFGPHIYQDGKISSLLLGQILFSKPHLKKELEELIHPKVSAFLHDKIEKIKELEQKNLWVFYESALIFETQKQDNFDEIIYVNALLDKRYEWLKQNRNWSLEYIQKIMQSQISDAEKMERSNFVIMNHGEPLEEEAIRLIRYLYV